VLKPSHFWSNKQRRRLRGSDAMIYGALVLINLPPSHHATLSLCTHLWIWIYSSGVRGGVECECERANFYFYTRAHTDRDWITWIIIESKIKINRLNDEDEFDLSLRNFSIYFVVISWDVGYIFWGSMATEKCDLLHSECSTFGGCAKLSLMIIQFLVKIFRA
jgi:hypothetical protein